MNTLENSSLLSRITQSLETDSSSCVSRGVVRQPKIEYLVSIKSAIVLMLKQLYSVSDQIGLINKFDRKNSVSDTTFVKFLNSHLRDEYLRSKKMRYFSSKLSVIKESIEKNQVDDFESQFNSMNLSGKINGNTTILLSVSDYVYFIDNYYNKELDFVEELFSGNVSGSGETAGDNNETCAANVVLTDDKKVIIPSVVASPLFSVENKGEGDDADKIRLHSNSIDFTNVKKQIKIYDDFDDFFNSDMDISIRYGKIDTNTDRIDEKFAYFFSMDIFQFIDLATLELEDEQLVVVGGTYHNQVRHNALVLYRYYKGAMYYIDDFSLRNSSPTLLASCEEWSGYNSSDDLNKLIGKYREYLHKISI